MESITDLINSREKIKGSERNSILKEIYELYLKDRHSRKIANWRRYCIYLRNHKIENTPDQQQKFKKSNLFIRELPPKVIAIKLAHIPTKDLYYLKSVCVDKANRKESVGAFLLGSIKIQNENNSTSVR